jgi:hypothetical protein
MAEEVPSLPFFFRIFSPNGQGIVYRADRDNGDSYMCTGSRQIGQSNRAIIWELGGYADAMPRSAMHTIMKPRAMSNAQTNAFVDENGLGAKYKSMSLYSDSHGFWFAEKSRSRSRSKSPKSPKTAKNSKGSKRGKSKNFKTSRR